MENIRKYKSWLLDKIFIVVGECFITACLIHIVFILGGIDTGLIVLIGFVLILVLILAYQFESWYYQWLLKISK